MSDTTAPGTPRTVVMQMTARRNFAIGHALERGGLLRMMASELIVPDWISRLAGGRLSRYVVDIPKHKLISAPATGLAYRAAMRFAKPHAAWPHVWAARRTAKVSTRRLMSARPEIVFGLDTGAVELFEAFDRVSPRPRLVLEQCVAPRRSQLLMVERLAPHFSEDERLARTAYIEAHRAREEAEWRLADIIVVPSAYVQEELEKAGADPRKIRMVPYGYTAQPGPPPSRKARTRPLKGLFVGGVDQRKGIHDLAAVAAGFRGEVNIDAYGKLIAGKEHIRIWGETINFKGPRPFDELKEAYQSADFLILPSHLEGSALVVYEAMAYGLPCIVTRETGSIVTNGVDGFIVDAGDRDGIAAVFRTLVDNPSQLDAMSEKARAAASAVSDETYGERLIAAILS